MRVSTIVVPNICATGVNSELNNFYSPSCCAVLSFTFTIRIFHIFSLFLKKIIHSLSDAFPCFLLESINYFRFIHVYFGLRVKRESSYVDVLFFVFFSNFLQISSYRQTIFREAPISQGPCHPARNFSLIKLENT